MDARPPIIFSLEGAWRVGRCTRHDLIDHEVVDSFRNICLAIITDNTPKFLAIDLTGVTHVVSAALGVLLQLLKHQKQAGGTVVICGLDPLLARMFHTARLDRVFELFPTVNALLKARPEGPPAPVDFPCHGP